MEENKEQGVYLVDGYFFAVLRPRSNEWHAAWRGLAAETGDKDQMAEDPETHECWQYGVTVWWRGRWFHEFRHRRHPALKDQATVRVPATAGWLPVAELRRRVLH
jgi:hypothetical protein